MIRKIDFDSLFAGVLYVLLVIAMGINGFYIIGGGEAEHLKYLSFYSGTPYEAMPGWYSALFYMAGALMLASVALVVASVVRLEYFAKESSGIWLRRALLTAIFAVLLYGVMMRLSGNNDGAAELYFYVGVLYLALMWVEQRWQKLPEGCRFPSIKLLPILLLIALTLGYPGVTKLMRGTEGMAGFVQMFQGSIFDKAPGGVVPFMFVISGLEALSGLMAIVALVRGEFLEGRQKFFFPVALLVSTGTFVALSLGLNVLGYLPGATNLVFYALFTLFFYSYVQREVVR